MERPTGLKRPEFWQALGEGPLSENVQLAWDTIMQEPTQGIPSWLLHPMEHAHIERLAGAQPGEYARDPERVYLAMQRAVGTCLLDQFIPDNPLTMGAHGYENPERGATTGAEELMLDGTRIESPESVVEHLERFEFPRLRRMIAEFDEESWVDGIIQSEAEIQRKLGPTILKSGHGFVAFPGLAYTTYGYVPYFTALGVYPEVMERHFALQADLALLVNGAAARAYHRGRATAALPTRPRHGRLAWAVGQPARPRPPVVSAFRPLLQPLLETGVRLIWHCDGNLMDDGAALARGAASPASRASSTRTAWTTSDLPDEDARRRRPHHHSRGVGHAHAPIRESTRCEA
jgi:hypothetical protein